MFSNCFIIVQGRTSVSWLEQQFSWPALTRLAFILYLLRN